MGILDLFRGRGAAHQPAPAPQGQTHFRPAAADYMRGGKGVVFNGWRPALRSEADAISSAWIDAASRLQDSIHNSGWIAGMLDQSAVNVVGTGLKLKAIPENEIFGMSNADASAWSKMVEARWDLYCSNPYECDAEGRRTFGQMQEAAYKGWISFGEIFGELPWRPRPGGQWGTKVRVVPPSMLVNETSPAARLHSGVFMDPDMMPVAYRICRPDPVMGQVYGTVPARDQIGRVMTFHLFAGPLGAVRGITPLAPALRVVRQFDQLADATLTGAIIQTVFAVALEASMPTEELMEGLLAPQERAAAASSGLSPFEAWADASIGWLDQTKIDVGISGRMAHMFPGQTMKFLSPEMPNVAYEAFTRTLLREVARCLGLTYESATGDYQQATYSSVRMAVNEIYQITLARRRHIVEPFCQIAYAAWLEEAIESGVVPFPGGIEAFLANRDAASRAVWRGSPKPVADDLKSAQAHDTYKRLGVMSATMIADELGVDIEDVYAQLQREKDLREIYGIADQIDPQTAADRSAMKTTLAGAA